MGNPTVYYRPKTVEEAVRLLTQPYITAVLLSGGALRLAATDDPAYEAVVDLQAVEGLTDIAVLDDGVMRLGASATFEAIARHPATPALLREAMTRSLTWNRRNAITPGEAVEYPGEVAEVIAALLALDATVIFALPEERRVPLAEMDMLLTQPRLPQKGLITAVEIALPHGREGWGAAYVARTPADEAIVYAAAVLDTDEDGTITAARLALAGAWEEPARLAAKTANALVGGVLDEMRIAETLRVLAAEVEPVADFRGSVEYRREMAVTMTRRVLRQCRERLSLMSGREKEREGE